MTPESGFAAPAGGVRLRVTGLAVGAVVFLAAAFYGVQRYGAPAAAALAALPLGLALLVRPRLLVFLLVVAWPLTSGMERGALVPFFRPNEVLLLLLVAVFLAQELVRGRPLSPTPVERLLLGFLAARCLLPTVVLFVRGEPFGFEAVRTFYGPVQYLFIYRIVYEVVEDRRQAMRTVGWMLGVSAVVAGIGLLQAAQVPGINEFLFRFYPSNKGQYTFLASPRLTSVFAGDWNGCGLYLAMNVILAVGLAGEMTGRRRALLFAVAALDAAAMLLTGSFTGTISLLGGLLLLGGVHRRARRVVRRTLLLVLAAGAVAVVTFSQVIAYRLAMQFREGAGWVPYTWAVRVYLWREVMWPYVERYWLWGMGTYRAGWSTEENYYMFLVLKTGIFGVTAYLAMVGGILRRMTGRLRRVGVPWVQALAAVVLVQLVQILVSNMSGSYAEYNGVSEMPWMLLAMIAAQERGGRSTARCAT